jgi:GT2 family glycosyltransferase
MGRLASVVLVTWNSSQYLPRCLAGLAQQSHRDVEVIHVDNSSHDDSVTQVRAKFPACAQILNATNKGFAAAVNQGVRVARGEVVFLINPDAYLEEHYIRAILDAFEKAADRVGMATGRLMRAEGAAIRPTGGVDSLGIRMTRSGRHLDITEDIDELAQHEVFGVSGAAAAYTRTFIQDVTIDGEFLDEDFFTYREDADVAWRGQLMGWSAIYVPSAVAYHVRRVTPERRGELPAELNMHSVKNRFLLRLKNEGVYLALRNAPSELVRDLIVIFAVLTVERSSLPALRWLWTNRRLILAKRKTVQNRRRVSDRDLAGWFH